MARNKQTVADLLGDDARASIIDAIQKQVVEGTGRAFSKERSEILYEDVVELIIAAAIRDGTFRLPRGLGSFRLVELAPTRRKVPTVDKVIEVSEVRASLKYREGDAVRAALGRPEHYKRRTPRKPLVDPTSK